MRNISSNFSSRRFPLVSALVTIGLGAASLSACTETSTEALGVATICGLATDAQGSALKLNSIQSSALAVVVNFCANPPTTAAAISADVLSAAITLQPIVTAVLKTKVASGAVTPVQAASATALLRELPKFKAEAIRIETSRISALPHLSVR